MGAARPVWVPPDRHWLPGRSVEGELHIGTFTTADAAIEKLDYSRSIFESTSSSWMPVNSSLRNPRHWGYDGVLWYSVHEPYGGRFGRFVRFIDACHARRLGVLIDAVFNPPGPSGNYLRDSARARRRPATPWGRHHIAGADRPPLIIDCAAMDARLPRRRFAVDAVHWGTTAVHKLEKLASATRWLSWPVGPSLIAETDRKRPALDHLPSHGGHGIKCPME